jgi:RNA polymerase sigma factor (sigma-70 family)
VKTVASAPANHILHHLRNLIRRHSGGGVTDGQLLERFVRERDETAFEVLVWRHGSMVLALGQRMLHNGHDAEDVLQATFLTLVRKAGSISKYDSLGSWLYKVAYRIALRVHSRAARMMTDGPPIEEVPAADRESEADWRELRPLLDGAIERLPEKYRTALVLCDLQGKSYREVAEQLGCPIGTVSTRVTRARQLLRKRLAHQGLALSLGALTAMLTHQTATAMPAALTASTVRAAVLLVGQTGAAAPVSANIAELIEGANSTMLLSRFQIAALLALVIGALAIGASVMARRELPASPADAAPVKEAKADRPAAGPVQVRGRVLAPDGKPISNARLYWPRVPKTEPQSEDDIEIPQRGQTDAEGRFQFELPRSDIKPEWKLALIAAADGYGVAWTFWDAIEKGGELTLRLVKDQPIDGRIVSSEGKPLAGVRVSIHALAEPIEAKLEAFIALWQREWRTALHETTQRMFLPLGKVLAPVTTDKDGHFRVSGAGAERFVVLRMRGAGVAQESLHVVNRAGFDAAAVNKAVLDRIPAELRYPGQPPLLYGPKLTYVVPAARRIEGTVREVGSGKPVPSLRIHIGTGYGEGMVAISDKEGRYHFDRVTKVKQYLLNADPPANTTWLMSGARINDTEGVQPLTVDFTVAHGIVLRGRVIDKATGKGVGGGIRFVPLPGNKFADKPGYDSFKYERLTRLVSSDGRFKFPVIPGLGVLTVQVDGEEKANGGQAINPYKAAEFDTKDRALVPINEKDGYFTAIDNSIEFFGRSHVVKVIDLAPDAGTAECDLFLERGQTLTVKIEDADGKPLRGTTVAGVTAVWPSPIPIKDATFTVFALDPKKPRRLLLYHGERNLAGSLLVRGDEKEPPTARLTPTGAVSGRILDREGQPIAGAEIQLSSPEQAANVLYQQLDQKRKPIHTDKEGRFRITGIVPEVKFNLNIYQGRTFLVGEPRIGVRQVKSGETLNLGDVKVKPGP